MPAIPDDFGAMNGSEIGNKETVLAELDIKLGKNEPPSVEYLLVLPFSLFRFLGYGWGYNAYGHSAVRYTLPSGEQVVMNIVGKRGKGTMVSFSSPEDFFFATKGNVAPQIGIYNRSIIGIRIENVPEEKVMEMHKYFLHLNRQDIDATAKFNIILGPISNFLRMYFPLPLKIAERGNCARWTSKGLKRAGLTTRVSMWPKSIWINMFENIHRTEAKSRSNVSVVSYRRIEHAKLSYGINAHPISAVAPLQSLRSLFYFDLEKFADAVVQVPDGSMDAIVELNNNPRQPSHLRNLVNNPLFIAASVIFTFVVLRRQDRQLSQRITNYARFRRMKQPYQNDIKVYK